MKDQNVKEEESARNDLAFSKSFLGSIAALLGNIFDAGGGTIMVVVELMQCSEVSNITQRKLVGILDDIRTRSRLCNATTQCGGEASAAEFSSAQCIPTSSNTFLAPRFCGSL